MNNKKTYKKFKEMNRRELINTCYRLIRTIRKLQAKDNKNSNGKKICQTILDVIINIGSKMVYKCLRCRILWVNKTTLLCNENPADKGGKIKVIFQPHAYRK